ncbi:unnamed protein product [Amaranthus hypochondriacus]
MNENLLISGKKTLSTFFKEEIIEDYESPSFHHLSQTLFPQSSSPLSPQCPESSWSHSPSLHPSQNSSLLYCCISSLRHDGDLYSIAVLRDLVLTGSKSRRIHVWQSLDCHTKGYIRTSSGEIRTMITQGNRNDSSFQGHQFAICCLVSLENLVLSGSEDSTIKIFRRQNEKKALHECVAVLEGHRGPIRCLATLLQKETKDEINFLVFSTSLDQTFKVWRVKVLQDQMKNNCKIEEDKRNEDYGGRNKSMELYEPSPVLSPSWVNWKLHRHSIH